MKPQVYHVDAFTSQPFRGNSAGVVFPADNLSEAQMQLIARELGHSETAFLSRILLPKLEAKCPGFTATSSMMSRRSSSQTCGNSSTFSFLKSSGVWILFKRVNSVFSTQKFFYFECKDIHLLLNCKIY